MPRVPTLRTLLLASWGRAQLASWGRAQLASWGRAQLAISRELRLEATGAAPRVVLPVGVSVVPPDRRMELASFEDLGVLVPIDVELALACGQLAADVSAAERLAVAFVSRAVRHGHVALDVAGLTTEALTDEIGTTVAVTSAEGGRPVELPAPAAWLNILAASALVAKAPETLAEPCAFAPLVLDLDGRLYLRRYFEYERTVARAIDARRAEPVLVDEACLALGLLRHFPPATRDAAQSCAAELAVRRRFAVISGGPGTGKTTTVVRILALLEEQAIAQQVPAPVVLLMAPTGKATDRLRESVAEKCAQVDVTGSIAERIAGHARRASTIHRALGFQPRTPTHFRHDASSPLACDAVVVDEASMVDVALMAKLFDALPKACRIILLGDKDQLTSVEAGAVLGELYGLEGSSAHLGHSHRFGETSPIARLTKAIKTGAADEMMLALRDGAPDLAREDIEAFEPLAGSLGASVREHFSSFYTLDPAARLDALGRFRILCAHRKGPVGVEAINLAIEQLLQRERGIATAERYYDGRPVLVTENDYDTRLYNGDVGVICQQGGVPCAFFRGENGAQPRAVPAARLPRHETAYAMTIHKSQGSEVTEVAVVLPERPSSFATRELVYTAVSRATRRVRLYGTVETLTAAVGCSSHRTSGLGARLRR
ncbi:MAG: exodeoxyribonuclease V subunit alpha [Myxococcales bacterium]|nr:exodeoxyribonuclease V subunit alpha [Myxococcales bacterium]